MSLVTLQAERTERFQLIEQRQIRAERLLTIANNEWLKEDLRLATKYLNNAGNWLRRPVDVEAEDARLLRMADASISFATQRITHIEELLDRLGPNATWIA
jgi:hypothetical protein